MNCVLNIRNCYTESIKTYIKRIQNISFPYTDFLQGSIALTSLKNNVPCNDQNCEHKWHYENLPNGNGFQRITECAKNHRMCKKSQLDSIGNEK